jgi:hypothetical protein
VKGFATGIAEFEGPESLAGAGQRILNDPSLALVVVRNMASKSELENVAHTVHYGSDQPVDIKDLHGAVEDWVEANPTAGTLETNSFTVGSRTYGDGPHIDSARLGYEVRHGPVTGSLRTDTQDHLRRHYSAARPTFSLADEDGRPTAEALSTLGKRVDRFEFLSKLGRLGAGHAAHVYQRPGDLILFANWPSPTIHAIKADHGCRAALYSYMIRPPR